MANTTFTTPGAADWTCPAHVFFVRIEVWGAGEPSPTDGSGGGGGGYGKILIASVTPGNNYSGQVGDGSSYTYSSRHSSFSGDIDLATGYGGGSSTGGTGLGDVVYDGGNGGASGVTNDGGGGGGGASSTFDGGNGVDGDGFGTGGQGGSSLDGGTGGQGGIGNGGFVSPVNGSDSGGGAGGIYGASTLSPSGPANGGNGKVSLTYTVYNSYSDRKRGGYRVFDSFNTLDKKVGSYAITSESFTSKQRGGYLIFPPMGGAFGQRGGYAVNLLSSPIKQRGGYRIYGSVLTQSKGSYRVQNLSVEGYTVYIGVDQLPDLTSDPDYFSSTLPFDIPVTPPVSGTKLLYVITRKRDSFGLESQNQDFTLVTVDSSGSFVYPALLPPQNFKLRLQDGANIRVLATYDDFGTDLYPADTWKVWYGTSIPSPAIDVPFLETPITGTVLSTLIESLPPATYFIMVGLYRTVDTSLVTVYGSIVVNAAPSRVNPVAGGFQRIWP